MYQKAIKVRLDLNNAQTNMFNQVFGCYRLTYNSALEAKIDFYELIGLYQHRLETQSWVQHRILKDLTKPYLMEMNTNVMKGCLIGLEAAFSNFFRNKTFGFPKFKTKYNKQSIKFYKGTCIMKSNLLDGKIHLTSDLKNIKFNTSDKYRKILINNIEAISSITVSKNKSNQFFASFLIETDKLKTDFKEADRKIKTSVNEIVGIDVGILSYLTDSNNLKVHNPKFFRSIRERIKYLQREVSKKVLGSSNRKKALLKLNKAYRDMTNFKENFIHNLTSKITDENQVIVLEDLRIKEMMQNPNLSTSIQELSLYEFKRQVIYKAEWKNRTVILADTFFPSSKMCSSCGIKKDSLLLNDRTFNCSCGLNIDRDLNAAINLKQYGEAVLRGDTHYFDYKLKTLEEHLIKLPEKQKPKTTKLNSGRKPKSKTKVKVKVKVNLK